MTATTGKTATEMRQADMRIDLRYMRASQLTAAILNELKGHIETHGDEDHWREVHYKLMKMFTEGGFDVVTDGDRAHAGLEQRDEMGWTGTELADMERRRLQIMLTPTVYFPEKSPPSL